MPSSGEKQGNMITFSINLSPKYRLHLKLVKRQGSLADKPLLPEMGKVLRVKKGNKFSRYFRYIFEHKNTKKILGVNLVLLTLTSIFSTSPAKGFTETGTDDQTAQVVIVLKTTTSIHFPTEGVNITQKFSIFHSGIDLDGVTGDPIRPIMDGEVEEVTNSKYGFGKSVLIDHNNGYKSLYAHLSKIEVSAKDYVQTSTEIGKMGSSGHASGDHLHLEVYKNDVAINPLSILNP